MDEIETVEKYYNGLLLASDELELLELLKYVEKHILQNVILLIVRVSRFIWLSTKKCFIFSFKNNGYHGIYSEVKDKDRAIRVTEGHL